MQFIRIAAITLCTASAAFAQTGPPSATVTPLVIGETLTMQSQVLGEARRINVYTPPVYADSSEVRLPVLYMPDGGIAEDFPHVAGLVQISVANGTMRPFILVGIENTQRRRDLTGPTNDPEDRKIAKVVGGSAAFRQFIRSELIPLIETRYRTTRERAIVGESLAGLFVVETFVLEPSLFGTYIAFDPSLWWNSGDLVMRTESARSIDHAATLYLASSSQEQIAGLTQRFAAALQKKNGPRVTVSHRAMPEETHGTIYHPAALRAFREVFGYAEKK